MSTTKLPDMAGASKRGPVRKENQDHFLVAELAKSMVIRQTSLGYDHQERLRGLPTGYVMVVADGIGGHMGGARASELAVETIVNYVTHTMPWFLQLDPSHDHDLVEALEGGLERAASMIELEGELLPRNRSMGTTLTMAYILWPRAYVVHVGDSRCYLLHDGTLRQVTRDHTYAEQLVESGLSEAEAADSPFKNILWNALGGSDSSVTEPEVTKVSLSVGDTLLLCSDGLSGALADDEIRRTLTQDLDATTAAEVLVEAALVAGSKDNVTAVVGRFGTR